MAAAQPHQQSINENGALGETVKLLIWKRVYHHVHDHKISMHAFCFVRRMPRRTTQIARSSSATKKKQKRPSTFNNFLHENASDAETKGNNEPQFRECPRCDSRSDIICNTYWSGKQHWNVFSWPAKWGDLIARPKMIHRSRQACARARVCGVCVCVNLWWYDWVTCELYSGKFFFVKLAIDEKKDMAELTGHRIWGSVRRSTNGAHFYSIYV